MTITPDYFLIPCFNDGENLNQLIEEILQEYKSSRVIIVDDGSEPRIKLPGSNSRVELVRLVINCGIGSAIKTGLIYARRKNAKCIVTVDADGQHKISEVKKLLELSDNSLFVIGSRWKTDYKWGKVRKFAHQQLNSIVSRKVSQNIKDSTSGFRLIKHNAINLTIELLEDEYLDDTALLLVRLKNRGVKISETSVEMLQRNTGKPSQSSFKLFTSYFSVILRILFEGRKK
jgi:glycosyltransferase involved in cell wall biosynthesis